MKKIIAISLVSLMLCISILPANKNAGNFKARIYIEGRKIVPLYIENGIVWIMNDGNFEKVEKHTPSENDGIPKATADGIIEKWALCIGISDYEGTSNDLNYCDDDAIDWKNFLQTNGYNVIILLDSYATASNIDNAINQLLANEDADDYVVFTYSGHGTKYGRYGSCMISHDMYLMTNSWFTSKFNNADSAHIYFAFDACQIGDFQKAVLTNRLGAFASNKLYSYDGDASMKNGVFTYYQMEGWNTYTTFEEDSAYAIQMMKNWAKQHKIRVDPFYVDKFTGYMYP